MFGGDLIQDTDSALLFYFPQHCRAFLKIY